MFKRRSRVQEAFEVDPNFERSIGLLFSTYMSEERYDEALRIAEDYQAKQPDASTGFNLEGFVHIATRDYEKARQAFQKAAEAAPGDVSANHNLANLELAQGNLEGANEVLSQALQSSPDSTQLMVQMAKVQALRGESKQQEQWLKKAYDRSGAAPEPAAALARYYFDRLDPSRSLAVSQTALIGSPDTPDLLKIAGQAQLVSGATSQAVATFRRLVTVKPDSAHNHFLLASAYLNQGDLDRTSSSLEQVLKLNPGHIGSKAFLVRILAHRRELDHAKALVADLKANAPQDYQVVRADAAVKIADGRLDDAVQTLRDVIDLPGAIRRRLPVTLAALEWQAGAHSES